MNVGRFPFSFSRFFFFFGLLSDLRNRCCSPEEEGEEAGGCHGNAAVRRKEEGVWRDGGV